MLRISLCLLCCIALAACATAAKPGAMVAAVSEDTIIRDDSPLREAIEVGDVGGGQETNPLWTSEVSDDDFRSALVDSLAAHAMLSVEGAVYRLDAYLIELEQPLMGFNATVTAIVKYTLTKAETGEVVFEEEIETPYTAKFGDAFVGVERLRLANEGAIRVNIDQLIKRLIATVGGSASETKEPAGAPVS